MGISNLSVTQGVLQTLVLLTGKTFAKYISAHRCGKSAAILITSECEWKDIDQVDATDDEQGLPDIVEWSGQAGLFVWRRRCATTSEAAGRRPSVITRSKSAAISLSHKSNSVSTADNDAGPAVPPKQCWNESS